MLKPIFKLSCLLYDSTKFPNEQDINLVLELEHKQVFKLKDTDKRVPGHILGHIDPYYIVEQVCNGYKLQFINYTPPTFLPSNKSLAQPDFVLRELQRLEKPCCI